MAHLFDTGGDVGIDEIHLQVQFNAIAILEELRDGLIYIPQKVARSCQVLLSEVA